MYITSNDAAVAFISTSECKEMWNEVSDCFDLVGFTAKEKDELFATLSGIMWLGDIEFSGEDKANIVSSASVLDTACRQLGLTSDAMEGAGESAWRVGLDWGMVEACPTSGNLGALSLTRSPQVPWWSRC